MSNARSVHSTNYAKKFLAGLVTLLALHYETAEAAYTMQQTCQYYPQGYIANPSDCQGWGYCSGGALIQTGKCGSGYLYDSQKGMCNYAANVKCGTTVANTCKNMMSPGFLADRDNCNRYCYCNNGNTQCHLCPAKQSYDPDLEECVYNYQCPADSVCRLVPNNQFVGNPKSCGQYIRCVGGTGQPKSCDPGLYFNAATGKCQSSNPCGTSPGTGTVGTTTLAPDTTMCATKYVAATGGVQYIADGRTCYGYYTCTGADAVASWQACPWATQFSTEKQACVTPYTVACTANRCGNINIPFVAVPGSSCKEYYICTNNQQGTVKKTCTNTEYPYIDEANSACVKTQPNYPICTAAAAPAA